MPDATTQHTELGHACQLAIDALSRAIDVLNEIDECEMARLRGNGDEALDAATKAKAALCAALHGHRPTAP